MTCRRVQLTVDLSGLQAPATHVRVAAGTVGIHCGPVPHVPSRLHLSLIAVDHPHGPIHVAAATDQYTEVTP